MIGPFSQDALATILILISAVLHAVSNALVKSADDKLIFRAVIGLTTLICMLPLLLIVPTPTGPVWVWITCAAVVHFSYQLVQISAFELSDLSFAFPIMRGIAPMITALGGYFFLSEMLTAMQSMALMAMCSGLVILAYEPQGDRRSIQTRKRALAVAILGAFMIALYTIVDASGVRAADNMFTYIVWIFAIDGLVITVFTFVRRSDKFCGAFRSQLQVGIIGGIVTIATYGLALVALRLGKTAEIAALRETSILFAMGIGALFLGEPVGRRRLIGAIIISLCAVWLKVA